LKGVLEAVLLSEVGYRKSYKVSFKEPCGKGLNR